MKREITLSNGIKIVDNRYLNCGVSIENNNTSICLYYNNHSKQLYINLSSKFLFEQTIDEYIDNLNKMKQSLIEANKFLNDKQD